MGQMCVLVACREQGWRWKARLGGLEPTSADKAGPENALIAQDARAAVLHAIQECAEVVALWLVSHNLPPLPADLQGCAPRMRGYNSCQRLKLCKRLTQPDAETWCRGHDGLKSFWL